MHRSERVRLMHRSEWVPREGAQVNPRGVQLWLGRGSQEHVVDTLVMSNLGYFQLKAGPGLWQLRLAPGRSEELYTIASATGLSGSASEEVPRHRRPFFVLLVHLTLLLVIALCVGGGLHVCVSVLGGFTSTGFEEVHMRSAWRYRDCGLGQRADVLDVAVQWCGVRRYKDLPRMAVRGCDLRRRCDWQCMAS